MKMHTLALTLAVATIFSISTVSAQEPPRDHKKETHRTLSKKPKQQCKTVVTKAKDRFGRQVVKKRKVCR